MDNFIPQHKVYQANLIERLQSWIVLGCVNRLEVSHVEIGQQLNRAVKKTQAKRQSRLDKPQKKPEGGRCVCSEPRHRWTRRQHGTVIAKVSGLENSHPIALYSDEWADIKVLTRAKFLKRVNELLAKEAYPG